MKLKIKRILIMCFLMFTISGCEATYNINIENNTIKEELIVSKLLEYEKQSFKEVELQVDYHNQVNDDHEGKLEGVEYYNKTLNNNTIKFDHEFTFGNYNNSYIANSCFELFKVVNTNTLIISTSKNLNCFKNIDNLDKISINLTTDYQVLNNNADSVVNNTYTWNVTKNNYKTKSIHIELKQKEEKEEPNKENNQNNEENNNEPLIKRKEIKVVFILILLIMIMLLLLVIITTIRNKKNNKF